MLKSTKLLREYYNSYYNEHFLRDVRYMYDKSNYRKYIDTRTGEEKESKGRYVHHYNYGDVDDSKKRVLSFLTQMNNLCKYDKLLGVELGYFNTLEEYKDRFNHVDDMLSDRLFFDSDIEDVRVDAIKSAIKEANATLKGNDKRHRLNELQAEYRELIFNEDLLKPVFEESKNLCQYLERFGLKPYLIFSGSKGFHVNVFFKGMKLINTKDITSRLSKSYIKELGLQYLDPVVSDREAKTSLQRVQYNINSNSGLYTLPIAGIYDYNEALAIIEENKRKPIPFEFEDYMAPKGFNKMLKRLDDKLSFERVKQEKRAFNRIAMNKTGSFKDIDMRDLCRAYGIDGKSDGEKIICKCPFHNDHNPSAVIFKSRFHCSTCNLTLNYYDFIAKIEGLTDKAEIMSKLRSILGGMY